MLVVVVLLDVGEEGGQGGRGGGQGGQEGPGVLTYVSLLTARLLTPWDATGTRRQQIGVLTSGKLLQISKKVIML